jgi:hypothetical protein
MKMASIHGVCHKAQKKAAGFSIPVKSCFSSGLPSRGEELHSIPHHLVEQIVVEDDTLTRAGVFNVKDQIRNAVGR